MLRGNRFAERYLNFVGGIFGHLGFFLGLHQQAALVSLVEDVCDHEMDAVLLNGPARFADQDAAVRLQLERHAERLGGPRLPHQGQQLGHILQVQLGRAIGRLHLVHRHLIPRDVEVRHGGREVQHRPTAQASERSAAVFERYQVLIQRYKLEHQKAALAVHLLQLCLGLLEPFHRFRRASRRNLQLRRQTAQKIRVHMLRHRSAQVATEGRVGPPPMQEDAGVAQGQKPLR
mmetsp:Transcript_10929/g.40861  ORF Transcript_10929/g.40861 Transcript_10929/m.40861 type:complete len:232 (+) Transcript_10929:276-971(+)